MASHPTTLASSIGQLNELQFNPAAGDEVAVNAADPAAEWLKTRGFVPVPDDRFPGQLVLCYPGRTGDDDEALKDEESDVGDHDAALKDEESDVGDHDAALKHEETPLTTVAKEYLFRRRFKRKVVSILGADALGDDDEAMKDETPDRLEKLVDEVDEALKDEEMFDVMTRFEKLYEIGLDGPRRYPGRTGDGHEALKNEETSVTTVGSLVWEEGFFWKSAVVSKSVLWGDAPAWRLDREWRIQNDEQEMCVFVNNRLLQELYVDATFRSANAEQAQSTKLRLTLERLCFGVDGCAINESTTRGYFVYQIEIEAKPVLPIPLYSATPEANKFSVQRASTSNASVTGALNLSEPIQISVGSTRGIEYSQESHGLLPARINGSAVTWKWQMLLWKDGQKFDTDNPCELQNLGRHSSPSP